MRRAITYCEPNQSLAGEYKTWKFIFVPASKLPKGAKLKFDFHSNGREIDWELPTANLKSTKGVIYGLMGKGKVVPAVEVEQKNSFVPEYEFTLPAVLEAGSPFTIVIGPKDGEAEKKTNLVRAQLVSQRRRPFSLYVDPSGKGRYEEPETFSMDIKGNKLANIRVLTPSFVAKNKRFDIVVRFEDEYGNLTNNAPEDTLIELSHENIRENLNWKLFVPETGFISLPNLYFNDEGVYTIQLLNTKTKEVFRSSPIRCFSEAGKHLFWGNLHGESERYDSTENIENCLRHFRDDKSHHFFAASPFESQEETSNEVWKHIHQNLSEFNEDERFTTFSGFQWTGDPKTEGHRIFVYAKEGKPLLRKKDLKSNTLKKIFKSLSPKELIAIPSFTMGKSFEYNFTDFDPDFERVVEIYNAWGSSETSKKEGNPVPIKSTNGIQESIEGSIQKALSNNHRFGFIGGGLDDRGIYSAFYDSDQEQYSPGLTAIVAPHHTREALFEALYNRSCYATTGERMLLGLEIAGIGMGKEVSTADKPGLAINRHIQGYAAGTTKLQKVELIRNGKVLKTYEPKHYSFDFAYDDMTSLEKVSINAKDKKPPFCYYYLKVTQEDGHIAWSSPIWVDYVPYSASPKKTQKSPQKPVAPSSFVDDDFDEEEEDEFDDFEN